MKGKTDFATDDDIMMMAAEFVRLAPDVKLPRARRPFAWFVDLYRHHADENDSTEATPESDPKLRGRVSAKLTELCSRGIFYQGYTWRCANCNYVNFLPVNDLAPLMPCAVCKVEHALAADFESRFHLDETIARGMREEGLRSVVFALGILRASATHAFMYTPPLDVNIEGLRPTDLDIVCVVDGRFVIGEAKDSGRDFTQAKSDDLIAAARILRPDAIVLACPDPEAIARVNIQIAYIKGQLADPRIEVRAITSDIRQDGTPTSLIARYFWRGGITVVEAIPPDPPPAAELRTFSSL